MRGAKTHRVANLKIVVLALVIPVLAAAAQVAEEPAGPTGEQLQAFAGRVYEAWKAGTPMPQLSVALPDASLADAYAIQKQFVAQALANDAVGGFKAAVVGSGGQKGLGIDGPLTGVVPASGVLYAADKIIVDLADDPKRAVESEIGYIFGKTIAEPLPNVDQLKEHVKHVAPVIEVPGGATENKQPATACDLVVWNINAKAIIVGAGHDPSGINPDTIEITLTHDGETVNTAKGDQAAGGQWTTLLKTVNCIVRQGYTIEPGHVITNGALGRIVRAEAGQYQADYGLLGIVAFEVRDTRGAQ